METLVGRRIPVISALFEFFGANMFYGFLIACLLGYMGKNSAIITTIASVVVIALLWLVNPPQEIGALIALTFTVAVVFLLGVTWLVYLASSGKMRLALRRISEKLPK